LDSLLGQLYDRRSPLYHQWLSVQEFTERFGPTAEDYESVVEFAEANGMKVTVTPANHRLVGVESSVATINRVFHVTMSIYQHPYEERTFYAPDREPTVDLDVPLLHIAGLSNIATAHSMLQYDATPEALRAVTTGSAPGGQYYGSDMRAAYYGGTALTGAGQSIGITE
jgi:subtilase family serine protease